MKNAFRLIFAGIAFWLSNVFCVHAASLEDGRSKYGHASAFKTSKPSALQRAARAEALLGFKYEHGLGVPQAFDVAADLYRRAAELDDPVGQYLLGLMYDKGHGVRREYVLAYMWLNLAAAHAPKRYRESYLRLRNAVASKMTQAQIVEGQRLAFEWRSRR
jgi:TPR repeat protein